MMKVSPRLGVDGTGGYGGTAVRASSARSITIGFQRGSECLPLSPCANAAAMRSSANAAAVRVSLLRAFMVLFLSFWYWFLGFQARGAWLFVLSLITADYGSEIA